MLIAPMFPFHVYPFTAPGTCTKQEPLEYARSTGAVCTDEFLLDHERHTSREHSRRARIAETERRLTESDPELPTVLVNHRLLCREPTRVPRYPEFAQWCGTGVTADWHRRFRATGCAYSHLHIPAPSGKTASASRKSPSPTPKNGGPRRSLPPVKYYLRQTNEMSPNGPE